MKKSIQALLIYTLLVIVWGAWVRISHSGDGCGASWPLCQDQLIPDAVHQKTWIEYAHRMMSGIYGLVVAALCVWVHRSREAQRREKFWAKLTLVL